jgi:hypothetical protein
MKPARMKVDRGLVSGRHFSTLPLKQTYRLVQNKDLKTSLKPRGEAQYCGFTL